MKNKIIRERAAIRGVKLWEIAARIGCSDTTFSKKLRQELPEVEQERILGLIDLIVAERKLE